MKEEFDFYNSTTIKSYNLDESIRYQLKTLDSLDAYTRRHTENVANITCRLCELLRMDKGFTLYCTTCAYLHDIGKIFIPPAILQKPSKLTDEEYEVMKTHTTIGYKICMNDLKLRPYSAGALYHHESLDGTGYPNKLWEKDIPYEAQIIRVADEFEAITAKRQYKTHIGVVDALNILIDHARPSIPPDFKTGLKRMLNQNVGKIDKNILKALFKVIIDDTEYEIVARSDYVDFIKDEIKRISEAQRYYFKMQGALTKGKREYYKEEIKCYLKPHEDPEKIPIMLQEFEKTYKARQDHIIKLHHEVRQIKKLSI
ncbi:MAG: HD domain-containing protein [Clostridia bacterium]|nr:HD domain-containing protein [Clostridia bacterium]